MAGQNKIYSLSMREERLIKTILALIVFLSLNILPQDKIFVTGIYEVIESDSCSKINNYYSLKYLSEELCLKQNPVIYISDFDSIRIASTEINEEKLFALNIKLSESATKHFEEVTSNNIGRRLALIINNEIIIAPVVKGTIPSGLISVEDDEVRIKELEKQINAERRNNKN